MEDKTTFKNYFNIIKEKLNLATSPVGVKLYDRDLVRKKFYKK